MKTGEAVAREAKTENVSKRTAVASRLVEAAIEIFGQLGFEATTTRMVAKKAGTQLTAIAYYFENKEGLYRAAGGRIGQGLSQHLASKVEAANLVLRDRAAGRERLIDAACDLLEGFTAILVGPDIPDSWSRFISRELFQPTYAFAALHNAMQPFGQTLCGIIGRLCSRPSTDSAVTLRMLMLVGQVLVFRSDRAAALAFLGWEDFSGNRVRAVRRVLRQNVALILRAGAI